MEISKTFDYKPQAVEGGYTDRILNINLDKNEINILELPPDYKHKYIGGRGYALKIIWDCASSETKYDSNENVLVMAGGPLCGDPRFPGSGKFVVGSISPLTGTFIDSNIGGHFAPLLKMCGFDALAFSGIASEDVVVIIGAPNGAEDADLSHQSFGSGSGFGYLGAKHQSGYKGKKSGDQNERRQKNRQ